MNKQLYSRLDLAERSLRSMITAPTLPIYDSSNMPQDAINAQIVIGIDNSINWFDGTSWHTQAGTLATVGNTPQDPVEGQIVIGSDCSLCWFVNGAWYGSASQLAVVGIVPQDVIEAQLVVGVDTLAWYCDGTWYTFVS